MYNKLAQRDLLEIHLHFKKLITVIDS